MNFQRAAAPNFFYGFAVELHLKQDRADSVIGGREKDEIALDDRAHGVDRFVDGRTEPKTEAHLSRFGFQRNQALAHEAEKVVFSVDDGGHWGCVAGLHSVIFPNDGRFSSPAGLGEALPVVFSDVFPNCFSGGWIEGYHAGIGLAADHSDEESVSEDWGATDSEEGLRHLEIHGRVSHPNFLARFPIQSEQLAFGAEGVATVCREQRRTAGSVVVAEGIHKLTFVAILPKRRAVGGGERFHDFVVSFAVMQNQLAVANGRSAVTGADCSAPYLLWPGTRPVLDQACFVAFAVGGWSQEARPIFAQCGRRCAGQNAKESGKRRCDCERTSFHKREECMRCGRRLSTLDAVRFDFAFSR